VVSVSILLNPFIKNKDIIYNIFKKRIMPLILDRKQVLDVYADAANRKWVLANFNVENLTTVEAILQATYEYGKTIDKNDLPIIIGITNKYAQRPQSIYYTHTRKWNVGLRLFLSDIDILTSRDSPYAKLKVMIHLDHIHWNDDDELLAWDMQQFSSIMYDASNLPFEQNIQKTAVFMEKCGDIIFIEGACDEIAEASKFASKGLTTPSMAEKYFRETGVDIIVANLGTEHRASTMVKKYNGNLAREITKRIGPCLCLHGTSSVASHQLTHLFDDGVRKVNIWTALERDSAPTLFQSMLENASKIIGTEKAKELCVSKVLGEMVDCRSQPSIKFYTTTYRQEIIFERMKEIVTDYLKTWYI